MPSDTKSNVSHVKPLEEPARCACRKINATEWGGCLLHEVVGYIDTPRPNLPAGPIFRFRGERR